MSGVTVPQAGKSPTHGQALKPVMWVGLYARQLLPAEPNRRPHHEPHEVRERDGRGGRAGGEHRVAGHQLVTGFEREADAGEEGDSDRETVTGLPAVAELAGDDQPEEGGVQARQTTVGAELRLQGEHGGADADRGQEESLHRGATVVAFREEAESEQRNHIPAQVVGIEVREVAGEEPPEFAVGDAFASQL